MRTAGEQLLAALRKTAATLTTGAGTEVEALAQAYRSLSNQYDAVQRWFRAGAEISTTGDAGTVATIITRGPVSWRLWKWPCIRSAKWRPEGCATIWAVDFTGTRSTRVGSCRTSRRCSTTTHSSRVHTSMRTGRPALTTYARSPSRRSSISPRTYGARKGGFYSARDADSEGEEGTFYVWTPSEIESALSPEIVSSFMRLYDVTAGGNFEGRSILHLADGDDATELEHNIGEARQTLLTVRSQREPPLRDEKVITSWSAMTVRAFAEAGAALGRDDFIQIAAEGADFLWTSLRPGQALKRTWKDGRAKIPAFLEDYAALGNALLSVHAATLQLHWLHAARTLTDELVARFYDADTGIFYDTPADGESLIVRPRDAHGQRDAVWHVPSRPSCCSELQPYSVRPSTEGSLRGSSGTKPRPSSDFHRRSEECSLLWTEGLAPPVEIAILGGPKPSGDARPDQSGSWGVRQGGDHRRRRRS